MSLFNRAGFSADQLQFIGLIVVTMGGGFLAFVWKAASWKTKIELDIANISEKVGLERGKNEAPILRERRRLRRVGDDDV